MKSNYILSGLILLALIVTTSCRKDASYVSLPEFIQKLEVNAFLTPDQTINQIYISSTKRRFGELYGFEPTGNLNVVVSDGITEETLDSTITNVFDIGFNFTIQKTPVTAGKTYHIMVISDKGLTAEASCILPQRRDFRIEVDTNSIKSTDKHGMKYSTLFANISITDPPGETNYYRLLYFYQNFIQHYENPKSFSLRSYLMSETAISHAYQPWEGDKMYNDFGNEGKKFVIRSIEFPAEYYAEPDPYFVTDSAFLRVYLINADKPYYDFHKSLDNYSLGDTPFTEPSFLYSNVNGGVGIFAGYTIDSLIFRLK